MHDVIIDDTKTSMAASQDRGFRDNKKQNPRRRRSFSTYLVDWIEKSFIIASLLAIDFLLFAGAGSYNMFASYSFFTLEVWYILAGIFILSFALIYLISFSSFLQNLLTAGSVSFFIIIMMNQFAAFDKNSMLAQLAATYISPELGEPLSNVSHVVFAGIMGLLFFVFLVYASKKLIGYFVMLLLIILMGITISSYSSRNENVKFKVVKDDVIVTNAQPGKRFVFIGMPTAASYHYLSEALKNEVNNPYEYERIKKTYDNILGFYASNRFTLYPYVYVEDVDPYTNMALSLNANNTKNLNEYKLNNISVTRFWKFNNMTSKYMYLQENKLYDTFKRAKYGVNAYQAGGIEMCYVNNEPAVDRCIEKNSLPIDFDGMDISTEEKVEVLGAQWIESMGLLSDFSYSYNLLKPFADTDSLPLVGVSYKDAGVKDSLEVLDVLERDLNKDNGNKAYFVDLNLPGNMYIYDEFCRIKPIEKWRNKIEPDWVKKMSPNEKKNAYNNQLNCVFGRLEKFLDNLNKSPSGKKTVVVLQGLSGTNGLVASKENSFAANLQNQKFVDMAIRDPLKKEFQVDESLCSAPSILKQYLYRKGKCQELGEFNLHVDAVNEMRSSLKKFKVDKTAAVNSAEKFKLWYAEWLKAQKSEEAPTEEIKTNLSEAEKAVIPESNTGNIADEVLPEDENKVSEVPVSEDNTEDSAVSEVPEIPETAEAPAVSEAEAEHITDTEPEKVIGTVKTMEKAVEDKEEAKVESLSATAAKTEAAETEKAQATEEPDAPAPTAELKSEAQELIPEEPDSGDISLEVPGAGLE